MSEGDEAVVRRFYEEMCNGRHNEIAADLFTKSHRLHDPSVPAGEGPAGMAEAVSPYQQGAEGHWRIDDIFSAGDKVVVRWTGTGTHVGDVMEIAPTGRSINVDAISIHRMESGRIGETWQVWDTLGFLRQLGVVQST